MLRASQAASRSVLAPLGRMGSRVPGMAMQRSGLSTAAAAATAVPRAMTGPMTGRMAGVGAISAGQVLAGSRRNATTAVSQEGAYANLRKRTGEFSPSLRLRKVQLGRRRMEDRLCSRRVVVDSGGYGLIGAGCRLRRLRVAEERHARRPKVARFRRLDVADPPSLPHPTLGPPRCAVRILYPSNLYGKSIDMQIKPEQRIKVQNPVVEVSPRLPLLHLAFLIFRQADAAMRSNRWTVTR